MTDLDRTQVTAFLRTMFADLDASKTADAKPGPEEPNQDWSRGWIEGWEAAVDTVRDHLMDEGLLPEDRE